MKSHLRLVHSAERPPLFDPFLEAQRRARWQRLAWFVAIVALGIGISLALSGCGRIETVPFRLESHGIDVAQLEHGADFWRAAGENWQIVDHGDWLAELGALPDGYAGRTLGGVLTFVDASPLAVLVAHELGHAMGLRHVEGEGCAVMAPVPCDVTELQPADLAELARVRN